VVNTEKYLKLFDATYQSLDTFKPTRQWAKSNNKINNKQLYIESVKKYQEKNRVESNQYKINEINEIHQMLSNQKSQFDNYKYFNYKRILNEKLNPAIDYLFDMYEPKLLLKWNQSTASSLSQLEIDCLLLKQMCQLGSNMKLFDRGYGAHFCIELDRANQSYMHLNATHYFVFHPNGKKFLANFKQNENYEIKT
jgi:hypothetical protein